MRIISLYQPYATLCVMGLKTNETRGWSTNVRGKIGIHATANTPKWCRNLLPLWPFSTELDGIELPTGKIIGTVELVDVKPTEVWLKESEEYFNKQKADGQLSREELQRYQIELMYGDYSENRFAWKLEHPEILKEPITARGSQGFWNYNLEEYWVKP